MADHGASPPAPAKDAARPAHIPRLPARKLSVLPGKAMLGAAATPSAAPLIPAKAEPSATARNHSAASAGSAPGASATGNAAAPTASAPPDASPGPVAPPPTAPPASVGATDSASATPASPRAAVTLLPEDAELGGPAMLVPYGPESGVAAFRRGGDAQMVFDVPRPLDLSQLKDDPVFGDVTERLLPDGMFLRMKLAPESQIRVVRRPGGWALAVVHDQPNLKAIATHADKGVLTISAASAGHVVVLKRRVDGGKIAGRHTENRRPIHPGRASRCRVHLAATWLGVVIEPLIGSPVVTADARRFYAAGFGWTQAGADLAGRTGGRLGRCADHDPPVRPAQPAAGRTA